MTYHHGWLYIDEGNGYYRELFNHARTAAYLAASNVLGCGSVSNILDDGGCEAYAWVPPGTVGSSVIVDSFAGPLTDSNGEMITITGVEYSPDGWYRDSFSTPVADGAPWSNPSFPESAQALGFWVTEWTGLDSGHIQREVTQVGAYRGGGVMGALGSRSREMGFEIIMLGESEAALDYLFRWLDATLSSVCATCATDTIVLRRICPDISAPNGMISSPWNLAVGSGNANQPGVAVLIDDILYLNYLDANIADRRNSLAQIAVGDVIAIDGWSFTVSATQDNLSHWQYTGVASGATPSAGLATVVTESITAADGVVEMRGVGLISGLQWGAPPVEQAGCFIRRANFTLAATDPCMYGFCTDIPVAQTIDWSACLAAANLNPSRLNCRPSCSEMIGECRTVFNYTISDPSGGAPVIELVPPIGSGSTVPIRIRTYANPNGLTPEDLCGAPLLGELYVASLPEFTELRYDVAGRRIEIRNAGTGDWINGFAYIEPNDAGVPRFFMAGCGPHTTIIEPADFCSAGDYSAQPDVTLSTQIRMGCA